MKGVKNDAARQDSASATILLQSGERLAAVDKTGRSPVDTRTDRAMTCPLIPLLAAPREHRHVPQDMFKELERGRR
jgi:hypothetical protein